MPSASEKKRSPCHRILNAYESTQVELRGQYSVERLFELQEYTKRSGMCRAIIVVVLTPVPCVALTSLVEAMKLAPPSEGFSHSQAFWLRFYLSAFLMTWCQFDQCRRLVTNLPFSPSSVGRVALLVATGTTANGIGMSSLIGFPLPFTPTVSLPGWFLLSGICFYVKFRRLVQQDAQIRRELWLVSCHLLMQGIMCLLYPLVGHVFATSTSRMQGVYSLLLPVLKLTTKNCMHYFLRHKEDFLPEVVILNVEIFHALFVCTCMQNANSFSSVAIIMLVDTLQSVLSIRDVSILVTEVDSFCSNIPSCRQLRRVSTDEIITYILRTSPRVLQMTVRIHSDEQLLRISQTASPGVSFRKQCMSFLLACRVKSVRVADSQIVTIHQTNSKSTRQLKRGAFVSPRKEEPPHRFLAEGFAPSESTLTAEDRVHIDSLRDKQKFRFVRQMLKLFHMTEFLLLVEFTEVIVPMIYGAFLVVVFHMPNRDFYRQLEGWDTHQLEHKVSNLSAYASLELLSFLVLALLLRRKLHMSTLHQLAFVLDKQWAGVQSRLLVWVMFLIQGSVEHYGIDPTFKFSWLKSSPSS